jgi:hypothetical protein
LRSSLFLALLLNLVSIGCSHEPKLGPEITVSGTFESMWWSSQQMENIDPNNPPPKTTRVTLSKWEYSDPVGVPHPDTVDFVATIRNAQGKAKATVTPKVQVQWMEGSIKDRGTASWGTPVALEIGGPITVGGGETQQLRVPVDLAAKMKTMEATGRWPWQLRVNLILLSDNRQIGQTLKELPITPGD